MKSQPDAREVIVPADAYEKIKNYVDQLNHNVHIFYSILDLMTETQDPHLINIKLPENVASLKDLSGLNKRLEDTFKAANVDGEFEFRGFDVGTEWYQIYVAGFLSYHFFLACLKASQEVMKLRAEYYKSEEAKVHFLTAKKVLEEAKDDKQNETVVDEKEMKKYLETWVDTKIREEAEKIKEALADRNGFSDNEINIKTVRVVKDLIKELDAGTEFHLSLNPPKDVGEDAAGHLVLDYKKIKELTEPEPEKIEEPKALPEGEDEEESDEVEE